MSVWSRENDRLDRMDSVVSAYKADQMDRAIQLEAQMRVVADMLHSVSRAGAVLDADECSELAKLIEAQL